MTPPRLCLVTSRLRLQLDESNLVRRIEWLAAAGIDLVQVRERDLPDRALTALVRRVLGAVRGTAARVVVNDRTDIALTCGAAGVHLREDSPPCARVRAIVPPGFLIGRSVHTVSGARAAAAADYLLFGTVFPSKGKPPGHPVAGITALRDVCAATPRPVLAIGGLDAARAPEAAAAGAAGIAAVDALLSATSAADARVRVDEFRRAFDTRSPLV